MTNVANLPLVLFPSSCFFFLLSPLVGKALLEMSAIVLFLEQEAGALGQGCLGGVVLVANFYVVNFETGDSRGICLPHARTSFANVRVIEFEYRVKIN
jgi:hypothetical protein